MQLDRSTMSPMSKEKTMIGMSEENLKISIPEQMVALERIMKLKEAKGDLSALQEVYVSLFSLNCKIRGLNFDLIS